MTKKKSGLAVVLTMLLVIFGLTACEQKNDEPMGTFYTLQEAYDEGLLTVEDLQKIADFYNNNASPVDVLTAETKQAIKKSYRLLIIDMPNASLERINLYKYYGTYNESIAVGITDDYSLYDYIIIDELDVAGVIFYDIHLGSIRIWNSNSKKNKIQGESL